MIVKLDHFPQDRGKNKNIWNHHPVASLHFSTDSFPTQPTGKGSQKATSTTKMLLSFPRAETEINIWDHQLVYQPGFQLRSSSHELFTQNLAPKVCAPENFNIDTNKWWEFLKCTSGLKYGFFWGIHVSFPGCKLWKLTFSHQTTTSIAPRSPKSSGLRPRSNKPLRFEQYPSGMPPKNIPMMFQDFRNIQQVGFLGSWGMLDFFLQLMIVEVPRSTSKKCWLKYHKNLPISNDI